MSKISPRLGDSQFQTWLRARVRSRRGLTVGRRARITQAILRDVRRSLQEYALGPEQLPASWTALDDLTATNTRPPGILRSTLQAGIDELETLESSYVPEQLTFIAHDLKVCLWYLSATLTKPEVLVPLSLEVQRQWSRKKGARQTNQNRRTVRSTEKRWADKIAAQIRQRAGTRLSDSAVAVQVAKHFRRQRALHKMPRSLGDLARRLKQRDLNDTQELAFLVRRFRGLIAQTK